MTAPRSPRQAAAAQAQAREALARRIDPMNDEARLAEIRAAVLAAGGTWIEPRGGGDTWGPHFCELALLGIYAAGTTMSEAICHWIKAVDRAAAAERQAA